MSAVVCGKRSVLEELTSTGTPVSKKFRRSSSTSPVRFSSPFLPSRSTLLDRLREAFPHMNHQPRDMELFSLIPVSSIGMKGTVSRELEEGKGFQLFLRLCVYVLIDRVLDECGGDIDAATKRLHELHLGSSEGNLPPVAEVKRNTVEDGMSADGGSTTEVPANENTLPADGAEWVEWFVREMMSASSLVDARARAARLLEFLEKSISFRACVEAAETYQKENIMLKEQNTILKHAVVIQHERQKEYENVAQELQHLKQLVPQYQEQLRNLEVTNYTLKMHLKQTQQSSSIPGRFHPDVF